MTLLILLRLKIYVVFCKNMFSKFRLYLSTLRYLTVKQIWYQLLHRLNIKWLHRRSLGTASFCTFDGEAGLLTQRWHGEHIHFLKGEFTLLSEKKYLGRPREWQLDNIDGLWLDQLFYLRYIELADGDELKVPRVIQWLKEWVLFVKFGKDKAYNPPFNPSERAFVLGRFYLVNHTFMTEQDSAFIAGIIRDDLDYVSRNLEQHLSGNHLFKNMCALLWGTLIVRADVSKYWQKKIDRYFIQVIEQQILKDGMHYELSPMYQTLLLADMFDIGLLLHKTHPLYDFMIEKIRKMAGALDFCLHPDDKIALFNDSNFSLGFSAKPLLNSINKKISYTMPKALDCAGYYQLSNSEHLFVIADCGDMGPDSQMGHAHADMLGFELSSHGKRVITNCGCSTYYTQPYRDYERSTQAHNTVEIAGCNQAELWSFFRVARRGHITFCRYTEKDLGKYLQAQHNAYMNMNMKILATHQRTFFSDGRVLKIIDQIESKEDVQYTSFLHFVPEARINKVNDRVFKVMILEKTYLTVNIIDGVAKERQDYVAFYYNKRELSKTLVISPKNNNKKIEFHLLTAQPQ